MSNKTKRSQTNFKKIWDTEDKVSSKAKLSKPNIISSLEGDAEAVGKSNTNRHIIKHVLKL